jgi:hypothetical protein
MELATTAWQMPVSTFSWLAKQGVNVNQENENGQTALFFALNAQQATKLLQLGANPHHQDHDGNTPLMWSLLHCKDLDTHKVLIQQGGHSVLNHHGVSSWLIAQDLVLRRERNARHVVLYMRCIHLEERKSAAKRLECASKVLHAHLPRELVQVIVEYAV